MERNTESPDVRKPMASQNAFFFLFCFYSLVLVSATQQHESAIIILIHICPPSPPHPSSLGCHRAQPSFSIRRTLSLPSCVYKSILYICVSIPSLQISSSTQFFYIPFICVLIYHICLSLSDLLHSVP